MNAYTTIEESKQLIEAGLDINTHDMFYHREDSREGYLISVGNHPAIINNLFSYRNSYIIPCWSLAALLNIINDNKIMINIHNDTQGNITFGLYDSGFLTGESEFSSESEDLVEEIIWLLKNNYIKSNKNE